MCNVRREYNSTVSVFDRNTEKFISKGKSNILSR